MHSNRPSLQSMRTLGPEAPPPSAVRHSITALHKDMSSLNIKVVARFRPKNELEISLEPDKPLVVRFVNDTTMTIGEGKEKEIVTFDRIFPPEDTQATVFEVVGTPVIADVLTGYNGTVFAYGQTGSGKTYSMMGADLYDDALRGIIPRAANKIFSAVATSSADIEFTLTCSMLEIYKESLNDLLCAEPHHLKIKEDTRKGIYVQGLTEVSVDCEEDMLELIALGDQMRTVGTTRCNAASSRSHTLFTLEVKQKFPNDSERRGKLNLVDLAGSEKVHLSGVTGNALDEAKKINLSLSALGNVIHALISGSEHVPYRDSKLTRLLQESLGGNYKTTIIVALSPCFRHFDETLNSIKFAQRAKRIQNQAVINIKNSPEAYQKIIDKLTLQLHRTEQQLGRGEGKGVEMVDKAVNTVGEAGGDARMRRMSTPVVPPQAESEFTRISTKVLKEIGEYGPFDLAADSDISPNSSEASLRPKETAISDSQSYDQPKETVPEDKYFHMKKKYKAKLRSVEAQCSLLEVEKDQLRSQVLELDHSLKAARKSLILEKEARIEGYQKYQDSLAIRAQSQEDLLKKQVESLENQNRILRNRLEALDEQYGRFIDMVTVGDAGVLEFSDVVEGPEETEAVEEITHELPLNTHIMSQAHTYALQIKEFLEPSSVLSGELEMYHLRNQVIQ